MNEHITFPPSLQNIFEEKVPEKTIYLTRSGLATGRFGGLSGQKETSATGFLWAMVTDKNKRKRGIKEIAELLRSEIKKIPGIYKFNVSSSDPMQDRMMGGTAKPISIQILGLDFDRIDIIAGKIKKIMESTSGVRDVSVSREKAMPEYSIKIDRIKAASLGIPIQTIANTINISFAGKAATMYRESGHEYDIFVRLQPEDRKDIKDLEGIEVISPSGTKIPLKNFVKISRTLGPIDIERKDQTRLVKVEANTFGRSLGTISSELENKISKILLSGDISIQYGGSIKEQKEAFADLVLAFILGLLLTYMVMAAQFESFRDPFIIMFSVPFGVVGVIWSLLLTGQTLNISSFIGLIMLVGIVVNNAIVFLDYTIQQKNQGAKIYNALIESGRVRLRPILMTSIAFIAGVLPLAISTGAGAQSRHAIGTGVMGGMIAATVLAVFLVPVFFVVMRRFFPGHARKHVEQETHHE